jgi:quercetin dioxygenase-like cupin family protein
MQDAWIEGDGTARWRSTQGPSGECSGTSVLEVPPGRRLPRHTDSAEETVVVVRGAAEVVLDGEASLVEAGGAAVIPADVPHEVRSVGARTLRFLAVYAAPEVTSTYERPVAPDGERERQAVGG